MIGLGLGVYWGGDIGNAIDWRPPLWEALVGGIVVITVIDLVGATGGFASLLSIVATAAILAFTVLNVRIGGMILMCSGLVLNLLVMIVNWGMPVSGSAMISAGLVDASRIGQVTLSGGRSIASGARLGFLGDVIGLPWGQVISVGDILILVGIPLVTASILRGMVVGQHRRPHRGGLGATGYADSLSALGRGPAPRRGPGLHPSRLGGPTDRRRSVDRRPPAGRREPRGRPRSSGRSSTRPAGRRPTRGRPPR